MYGVLIFTHVWHHDAAVHLYTCAMYKTLCHHQHHNFLHIRMNCHYGNIARRLRNCIAKCASINGFEFHVHELQGPSFRATLLHAFSALLSLPLSLCLSLSFFLYIHRICKKPSCRFCTSNYPTIKVRQACTVAQCWPYKSVLVQV